MINEGSMNSLTFLALSISSWINAYDRSTPLSLNTATTGGLSALWMKQQIVKYVSNIMYCVFLSFFDFTSKSCQLNNDRIKHCLFSFYKRTYSKKKNSRTKKMSWQPAVWAIVVFGVRCMFASMRLTTAEPTELVPKLESLMGEG